jgi:hypothetical protein
MKTILEWFKTPETEVHATGWPAVAVMVCIAAPFIAVIYAVVKAFL